MSTTKIQILVTDDVVYAIAKKLMEQVELRDAYKIERCIGILPFGEFNPLLDEVIFLSSKYDYFEIDDEKVLDELADYQPGFYEGEISGTKVILYGEETTSNFLIA